MRISLAVYIVPFLIFLYGSEPSTIRSLKYLKQRPHAPIIVMSDQEIEKHNADIVAKEYLAYAMSLYCDRSRGNLPRFVPLCETPFPVFSDDGPSRSDCDYAARLVIKHYRHRKLP